MTPPATPSPNQKAGFLFSLAGFAVLALHDATVKFLADYSVFQIVFFAMLFSYVPLSFARLIDPKEMTLRPVHPELVLLRSALMVASLCFAFAGFAILPLVEMYALIFTYPLIISILSIPILKEQVRRYRWVAMLTGLIGVMVVLRPTPDNLSIGHAYGLLCATCSACAGLISRKIASKENAATMMLTPIIMNILVSGSALYFVYQPMPLVDLVRMFLIGILALCGQLLMLYGYRNAPATLIAPAQYSQIIWAMMFGALWFDEQPDNTSLLGVGIIVMAGLFMIWRESRFSAKQPILRSRNMRIVGATSVPSASADATKTGK